MQLEAAPPQNHVRLMNASLALGIAILGAKWAAYIVTGSVVIFSDALESVVHVLAVALAWYALRVSFRPPDREHPFGHFKAMYFSAGVEGGLIVIAAATIAMTAVEKLFTGVVLQHIGEGIAFTLLAAVANLVLGILLVREGKRSRSPLLIADGKHVLADVWTSAGAVLGLLLINATEWWIMDPLLGCLVGIHLAKEGVQLVRGAIYGLMDQTNPELEQRARRALEDFCAEHGLRYHRFRLREVGPQVYIDFHLQFADGTPIEQAHKLATEAEERVAEAVATRADIMTHLEGEEHAPTHDDFRRPRCQDLAPL